MNQDQFLSWFRTTLGMAGLFIVQRGWATDGTVTMVVGILLGAAPFLWGYFVHSESGQIATAKALPTEAKIDVAKALPMKAKIDVADTISDSAKLALVEKLPDVKKIVVAPSATDGVEAAVKDAARPKVVSTPPGDPMGGQSRQGERK